jgi:hypothetical protein
VIWTWSTKAVRDALVLMFRTLRRIPKLEALTCAGVQVVAQRSFEAPYVRVESDVPQSVPDALSDPDGTPALSKRTSTSSMLLELLAARSISASMPTTVAVLGIEKPKPETSRFAL